MTMKLFFLDIDGTIAMPGTDPTPELYAVIRRLQAAGLGIAMGNSAPEVKALADRICSSCENNGLAKALAEFIPA